MTGRLEHQVICVFVCITILSSFSDCGYCPASVPTVSVVSKCPTNKTEWDQAASRKKCSHMSAKCGDKSPVYHCLLNQWGNETVEVCASTWYMSGFCAIYNTDEMKVIDDFERDCTKLSEETCPSRYISSEAYMYQKCYMKKSSNTIPDRSIGTKETNDCIMSSVIAIVVTVLVLAITSLVVFITLRLKISKKAQDEECMPFCNATKQMVGKKDEVIPLMKNENKDNAMNQTKETAELISFGDAAASKQMPDTHPIESQTKGDGVHNTRAGDFNEIKSKFEMTLSPGQNPSEREIKKKNTKATDPVGDKENAVKKDDIRRTVLNTINDADRILHGNIINEEGNDEDPAADKENVVQKDHTQKADHCTNNDNDCTLPGNIINEEGNDEEVEKKMDNTIKNDVDFSSPESLINEENSDEENNQSPDPTPSESVTDTPNEKPTDSDSETEKQSKNEEIKKKAGDSYDGKVSEGGVLKKAKIFGEIVTKPKENHDREEKSGNVLNARTPWNLRNT